MRQCVNLFACALAAFFIFMHGAAGQSTDTTKRDAQTQTLINSVPIPPGHQGKGIRFPYKEDGKLKIKIDVDVMERKDLDHIEMTNAKIITFDDNQKEDMTLLLPLSVLNLTTRVLTTGTRFALKKADFELIGDSLQLDTWTKHATINGNVKMVIYNLEAPGKNEPAKKEPAHD